MVDDSNRWLLEELTRQHNERVEMVHQDRYTNEVANEKHLKGTAAIGRYMLYRGIIETLILIVLIWRSL